MGADLRSLNELIPFPNECLPRLVCRVRLACHNELDGPLRIRQKPKEPLSIMKEQIGPFVSGKPSGKAKSQNVGVK